MALIKLGLIEWVFYIMCDANAIFQFLEKNKFASKRKKNIKNDFT